MTFFSWCLSAFPEVPEEATRSPQQGPQLKITPETLVAFGLPAAFSGIVAAAVS